MKRLTIMILLMPLLMLAQKDTSISGINWVQGLNWQHLKAKAKAENKYIFVYLTATWCIPCKEMQQNIFTRSSVYTALNKSFIPVKVQTDITAQDNEYVKSWYEDAKKIREEFKVNGVPTYLFFAPDGTILHRDDGLKNASAFINLTWMVRDPNQTFLYPLYQSYIKGKKIESTNELLDLAIFTWKYIDKDTALIMAKKWKKHLDKLPDDSAFTTKNLQYITYFNYQLIKPNERYFNLCYNQPKTFEVTAKWPGRAVDVVQSVIMREELDKRLNRKGKWIIKPNWNYLEQTIAKKYKKVRNHLPLWMVNYKINYYSTKCIDWHLWADAKDEKIKNYLSSQSTGIELSGELNDGGAWRAFLGCSDTVVLIRALRWIDIALQRKPNSFPYIDTKANLLYKLGRQDEAIALEEKCLEMVKGWVREGGSQRVADEYSITLEKMKKGIVTWSDSKVPKDK
jgi:thioredoxin-related protein